MIADDLFAGAGGWDLAAGSLGIRARGVENMTEARATRDAVGLETIHDDVWTFQPDGAATGQIASPPCPTFSSAGNGTGRRAIENVRAEISSGAYLDINWLHALGQEYGDERTALVLTPLHFALTGGYEWLAWEQVPPVLPVWEACAAALRERRWHVWTGVLNSEQYGVAQTRRRAVLLASRRGPVAPPTATHSRYYSRTPEKLDPGVTKWVSMAEALGWGLRQRPSFTVCGVSSHAIGDSEWGGKSVRDALRQAADSGDQTVWEERQQYALSTGTRANAALRPQDHPSATLAFGHDAASYCWVPVGATAAEVVDFKLRNQLVDPPGWRDRTKEAGNIRVTVPESAVLQSFPAWWPFQGNLGRQYLQIGNAVPPLLAQAALAAVVP